MGNIADKVLNSLKLRFKVRIPHRTMWHICLRFSSPPAKSQKYYIQTPLYGHPINTDTSLLRTVRFAPGEKNPYILSNFNPLNTDTPSIRTLSPQCPYQRGLTVHTYILYCYLPKGAFQQQ